MHWELVDVDNVIAGLLVSYMELSRSRIKYSGSYNLVDFYTDTCGTISTD